MSALWTQSLGSHGDVGPLSRAMNSTSERKPSGLASCSGLMSRNSRTTPPAARTAITLRMSFVRRAGNRLTSNSVIAEPITVGSRRNGMKTLNTTRANIGPPSKTIP